MLAAPVKLLVSSDGCGVLKASAGDGAAVMLEVLAATGAGGSSPCGLTAIFGV